MIRMLGWTLPTVSIALDLPLVRVDWIIRQIHIGGCFHENTILFFVGCGRRNLLRRAKLERTVSGASASRVRLPTSRRHDADGTTGDDAGRNDAGWNDARRNDAPDDTSRRARLAGRIRGIRSAITVRCSGRLHSGFAGDGTTFAGDSGRSSSRVRR